MVFNDFHIDNWLEETGLFNADMGISIDQEFSTQSVARKLAQHRRVVAPNAQVIVEAVPMKLFGTKGVVERFSQSLQDIARTLTIAMQGI